MHSRCYDTIVMTEFAPYFFQFFPELIRNPRIGITRVYFSRQSEKQLRQFFDLKGMSKVIQIISHLRKRNWRAALCMAYLTFNRRKIRIFDPAYFSPMKTDYLCSLGFMRRIPVSQIELSETSSNIHWSLLPRHRGCHPVLRAFRKGDKESGVTIHQIEEAFDSGDILYQRGIPVAREDTPQTYSAKLGKLSRRAFADYLRNKPEWDRQARPQDPMEEPDSDVLSEACYLITPGDTASEIRKKFRSAGSGNCYIIRDGEKRQVVRLEMNKHFGEVDCDNCFVLADYVLETIAA